MDTPDRNNGNQIASSVAKFEDSPIFNFINELSPIKPMKCNHLSRMMIPLHFPSVFTSPHINSQREFRISQRNQLHDLSKPEFASDNGITSRVNTDDSKQLDTHGESLKIKSDGELAGMTSLDCLQFEVGVSEGSIIHGSSGCNSENLVSLVPDSSQEVLHGNEVDMKGKRLADQNTQTLSYECESLLDALLFESTNDKDSYNEQICPDPNLISSVQNGMHHIQSFCEDAPDELHREANELQHLSSQPGSGEGIQTEEAHEMAVGTSANHLGEEMEFDNLSGLYRGTRRRCLVFEMGGTLRKHMHQNFGSSSSSMLHSEINAFSIDQNLVQMMPGNNPSSNVLPGIGVHLNALATTPGRPLVHPNSSFNFHLSPGSEMLLSNMLSAGLDEEKENSILPVEDPGQSSGYMEVEDTNQSSPKKKRRRAEASGNAEGCRRCNCKKSKCLKLYCECFAAGVYCVDLCACIDCFNKPVHEDTVLATRNQIESRNPLAFAPKVIRGTNPLSESGDESSKTPASARHKRGCNCKKSGCLKKYCECYQGGVGCSINCRCEGCKNTFGRKDGIEADMADKSSAKILLETDSCIPATPLLAGRQYLQQQFSVKNKPKQSFHSQPQSKLDHHLETITEDDELPWFLQEISSSPSCVVKSSSPNGKRVSSPRIVTGLRSSRKLILQSIPSFPSLTQNQ